MNYILEGHREVFNFGPDFGQYFEVERVANDFLKYLGQGTWKLDEESHLHEAGFLTLDSRKAAHALSWSNKYNFDRSLQETAKWYRDYLDSKDLVMSSRNQVEEYLAK